MLQTTYLTTDKLKSFTPISNNVDISQLENWIPVAEQLHINGILGVALDSALKTELESLGTLSGNNATLLTYLENASAWFTFYEASTFLRTKFLNKGIVQQYSDNSQVAPWEDFKAYRQVILDIAHKFRNDLIDYLETNKILFPLFRSNSCDDDCTDGYSKDYGSGIYV